MSLAFSAIALVFYLLALWLLGGALFQQRALNKKQVSLIALGGGAAHITAALVEVFAGPGADFSLLFMGSLIFSVTVLLVALSSFRHPLHAILLIILPIAACLLAASLISAPTKIETLSPGTLVHVVFSVLAYGVITIAASCALVLYYCNYLLKHKQVGRKLEILPPMETIDRLLFEMILAGEVLLTLSIVSGLIFVEDFLGQKLPHKTFFSLISWAIFGALIIGHYRFGWRGARAIKWTLAGFTALLLAYVGSKFVIEWILGQ